jgi:hypothetical protein
VAEPKAIITTVIGIAAKLGDLLKTVEDAEAKTLMADLQLHLASLKVELANQKEEMATLKNDYVQLTGQLRAKNDATGNMVLRDGAYYFATAPEGRPDGPYCTRCRDIDNRLVLVSDISVLAFGKWRCPQCRNNFS